MHGLRRVQAQTTEWPLHEEESVAPWACSLHLTEMDLR
jgi:hypothetical protein